MDNLNTDNLIQEIRSGNKEAVKSVYQAYAKDVYNFSKSITGDHDSALAATKKTFLTLFKNIQNGDEPSNIRTAALKIAYDEAYKNTASDTAAKTEEAETPVQEEATAARRETAPVIDDYDEEEEYDQGYEEEEDDFVPPARDEEEEPESVYIPKGGYDTLKIDPVDVDEEQTEMRSRRRRPRAAADEFEDEYEERPRSRRHQDDFDGDGRDVEYYDDYDEYEERKPRRKGLFIFCIILNIVLILILLWFLGGLLINLGVLPDIDLGYSWFNGHIYPLF